MKWALVLSGGGAAGLAYIGFFKALEELNLPKPDCIVGCSMGALIRERKTGTGNGSCF